MFRFHALGKGLKPPAYAEEWQFDNFLGFPTSEVLLLYPLPSLEVSANWLRDFTRFRV